MQRSIFLTSVLAAWLVSSCGESSKSPSAPRPNRRVKTEPPAEAKGRVAGNEVGSRLGQVKERDPGEITDAQRARMEKYFRVLTPIEEFAAPDDAQESGTKLWEPTPGFSLQGGGTIDLSGYDTPARDQGEEGKCTAFGLIAVVESMLEEQLGPKRDLSEEAFWDTYRRPNENVALNAAVEVDLVPEDVWPYGEPKPRKPLDGAGVAQVMQWQTIARTGLLRRLFPIRMEDVYAYMRDTQFPVYFITDVNESFMDGTDGMISTRGRAMGGHAMAAVGMNLDEGWFKIKNSWSAEWGDNGYAYVPFEYCLTYFCKFFALAADPMQK